MDRGQGFVLFRPRGKPAGVRVPDSQLTSILFSGVEGIEEMATRFDRGAYTGASEIYNQVLPTYQSYIGLPTTLSDEFPHWMIASYWSGDYERAIKLAEALTKASKATPGGSVEFYSRLARMDQGGFEEMSTFLKTSQAATLYPEGSAVRMYIQSRLLQHEDRSLEAIRTISQLIAKHSHDADWMPQAELLCAELYYKLEMSESGDAVLADINEFYFTTNVQNKAAAIAAKQQ